MTDKKPAQPSTNQQPEPLNREMRRARQFDHEAAENPAFGTGDDSESYAGRPDQDVVKTTGSGTGGATESDGRVKHHEGQHLGNQPNS